MSQQQSKGESKGGKPRTDTPADRRLRENRVKPPKATVAPAKAPKKPAPKPAFPGAKPPFKPAPAKSPKPAKKP